jgi:predicted phosphodiesterase
MLNRRQVLGFIAFAGAAGTAAGRSLLAADADAKPVLRAGLLTDLHYADKPAAGVRIYRDTLAKLTEAVDHFNKLKVDVTIELGDLIDEAPDARTELQWLGVIEKQYARLASPRHYVLGNHCVTTLTKQEFLDQTGGTKQPHYAFDVAGVRFVVLDACFRADGKAYDRKNFVWNDANIPATQIDWLSAQLKDAKGPAIVCAHQRLDGKDAHCVKNAADVRTAIEKAGNVLAVFQGHSHKNDLKQLNGVPYCTLVAMVEGPGPDSSGYGVLEVFPDHSLRLTGGRRQENRQWERRKA